MSTQQEFLKGSLNPLNIFKCITHNIKFLQNHPYYFKPSGLLLFCGAQGSGKTLSAVQYVTKLSYEYPKAIICTNVDIQGLNPDSTVVEYNGLDDLKNLENGYHGVIYLIDEIHLEYNSLESKNIDIEIMVEVSQQRKQRKHIVGTSQVYGRLAKPFREQISDIILCRCFFGIFQFNKFIDGTTAHEENGKLKCDVKHRFFWFHNPCLYNSYDTYAKMRRYRNEWQGRPRIFNNSEV